MRRRITSIILWLFGFVMVWLWVRDRSPKPVLEKAPQDPIQDRTKLKQRVVVEELDSTAVDTTDKPLEKNAVPSSDSLTRINGIGMAFEKALNEIGIYTYEHLAGQQPTELANRMSIRITAERIERDRWIEQARELSNNAPKTDEDISEV